ncbi:MAG: 4Fe-4S binding protein [Proteobacteria bacterium]|nr:4Fe-4S binding protein [Pseudomonadota bacterium]
MLFVHVAPVLLAALLMGAHFLRIGNLGLVAACLITPTILLIRRSWIPVIAQLLLIIGAAMWLEIAIELVRYRAAIGEPWTRMLIILGIVALFTALSSLTFFRATLKHWYSKHSEATIPSAGAFLLTALTLSVVQMNVANPMLIFERFLSGAGWIEILALSIYAAWITDRMLDAKSTAIWRRRIWLVFSVVFFAQLVLGLSGVSQFLMTGELHLPVPALIAAGPIFRGEKFFMLILFGATLLLVGPAWCSHLCYIGAWDHAASLKRRQPNQLPLWTKKARVGILVLVIVSAILLRISGATVEMAGALALVFGFLGVVTMLSWSRKNGVMVHCTVMCPIGLIANLLGKLSLFRIRIREGCTQCGKCSLVCRYNALSSSDIENKCPGLTCTLCGDCIGQCKDERLDFFFTFSNKPGARAAFITLAVSLHAIFMGVARI